MQQEGEGEHPEREARQQLGRHDPRNSARLQQAQVAVHKGSILAVGLAAGNAVPQGVQNSDNLCTSVDDTPTTYWVREMSDTRYIVIALPSGGSPALLEGLGCWADARRDNGNHGSQARRAAGAVRRQQDQPRDRARQRRSEREHHLGHPDRQRTGAHPLRRHHHPAARRGRHPGRAAERQRRPCLRHRRRPAAAQDHLQARARRLRDRRGAQGAPRRATSSATSQRGVEEKLLDSRLQRAVRPGAARRSARARPRTSCSSTSASSR